MTGEQRRVSSARVLVLMGTDRNHHVCDNVHFRFISELICTFDFFKTMTPIERGTAVQKEVESKLPDFAAALRNTGTMPLIIHQDAFAADYQDAEYVLLGKAIKYAGIFGKEIHIHGRNRETLDQSSKSS